MVQKLLDKYGPDQLSFYVEDLDKAAERFNKLFGAGPFIKMGPMTFEECIYRGKKVDPTFEIALGMWGPIEVELVHKISGEPYLFDEYGYGFNHINVIVDDYDQAIAEFAEYGFEPGMTMISSGKPIAYVDCMDELGLNIEIHGPDSSATPLTKKAKTMGAEGDVYVDLREVMAAMRA